MGGQLGGAVDGNAASQQKNILASNLLAGSHLSVLSFHVLPKPTWLFFGYLKDIQVRLIQNSTLPVSERDCFSLNVSPAINWRHVQDVCCLSSNVSLGSSPALRNFTYG